MLKKIICFILILSFCICLVFGTSVQAHADALTMFTLGGALYGIAQSVGFTIAPNVRTGESAQTWAENTINSWLGGRTLTQAFGSEIIRLTAGKLVVGQRIYNGIMEMLGLTKDESGVEPGETITYGDFYGRPYSGRVQSNPFQGGVVIPFDLNYEETGVYTVYDNNTMRTYVNGIEVGAWSGTNIIGWGLVSYRDRAGVDVFAAYSDGVRWFRYDNIFRYDEGNVVEITLDENYNTDSIDAGYQWEGYFPELPDTNLDQLIDSIYDSVADTNLDVESSIEKEEGSWTPVDDVIDGINQGGEVVTDINDLVGDIAGSVDDINVNTAEQVNQLEGINEAIGENTGVLQGIAEAIEAPEIEEKSFDLRELFPFCIPFDIYHLLQKFDGTPTAPHVQLPIVIPSIGFSYTMDLDFSAWDPVAAAMRTVELIVYALGLAWATSKVIKW